MTKRTNGAWLGWNDCASWADENGRSLVFDCALGEPPGTVFLPSPSAWPQEVPAWAAELRDVVVADFEQYGVRVAAHPHAKVRAGGG
jgi:hypothetical protein